MVACQTCKTLQAVSQVLVGHTRLSLLGRGTGKRISEGHAPCKSDLLLLCERFQALYGHTQPDGSPSAIGLNAAAVALGVPRRRLYDIINVLEAVEARALTYTRLHVLLIAMCC